MVYWVNLKSSKNLNIQVSMLSLVFIKLINSWTDDFFHIIGAPGLKEYDGMEVVPGEECSRQCTGDKPKVCYFEWALKFSQTMGEWAKNNVNLKMSFNHVWF